MPKDTSDVVLGMLSSAGSATRPAQQPRADENPPVAAPAAPARRRPPPAADARDAMPPAPDAPPAALDAGAAPRTMRLRPETAARLRAAWLEAKRNDVLLTAQDFASSLVEDALASRRRARRAASSA
jgi:hypothetical protein